MAHDFMSASLLLLLTSLSTRKRPNTEHRCNTFYHQRAQEIHRLSPFDSRSCPSRHFPSSGIFGGTRLLTVGMFKCSAAAPPESQVKKERREKRPPDRTEGVSERDDGAAGTCPGMNTHLWLVVTRGERSMYEVCACLCARP